MSDEQEQGIFLASNNVLLPVIERVRLRLAELKKLGKPEFHRIEGNEHMTIEPKMPIHNSLEFWDCVKKIDDDEYKIIYDVYSLTKDGKVENILIRAGPGDPGRLHKILAKRVTETLKKGVPIKKEEQKLEDREKLLAQAGQTEEYSEKREEKMRGK